MKLILLFAALFIAVGFSSARDKIKGGNKLVKKLFDHKSLSYDTSVYSPDRDVKFHLVVKVFNSTDYLMQPIKLNNASTLKNFDVQLNTKLIIHGWNAFRNDAAIVYPVKAFLQHDQDYNLITVDWRRGAIDINYFAAKDRVESTGKTVAKFINFLAADGGADFNNIHIVGFSLGAHVAGFCGKTLNGSLGAIYGLEPAQPGFSFKDDVKRLAFTDAKYVEVVHTSKLSFRNPLGHVDFYANGGTAELDFALCLIDYNANYLFRFSTTKLCARFMG